MTTTPKEATEAEPDELPPSVTDLPAFIWLNYGDIERDCTHAECYRDGEVTWCQDSVFASDVKYVRADLATQPAAPVPNRLNPPHVYGESELYRLSPVAPLQAAPMQSSARWYSLSREGIATLCTDEADARSAANHSNGAWPSAGPHRAVQLVELAAVAQAEPPKPAEIRCGGDGLLDEIVGAGLFHLEQMSDSHWWMSLDTEHGQVTVNLTAKGRIKAAVEEAKESKS
jgi:hypothetical protein